MTPMRTGCPFIHHLQNLRFALADAFLNMNTRLHYTGDVPLDCIDHHVVTLGVTRCDVISSNSDFFILT